MTRLFGDHATLEDALASETLPYIYQPPPGHMFVAVGPDDGCRPLSSRVLAKWTPASADGATPEVRTGPAKLQELAQAFGPEWRAEVAPYLDIENPPHGQRAVWRDGAVAFENSEDAALMAVRGKRDHKLRSEVDEAQKVMRWSSLTPRWQKAWGIYRQALLDITKGDLFNPDWPNLQKIYDGLTDEPEADPTVNLQNLRDHIDEVRGPLKAVAEEKGEGSEKPDDGIPDSFRGLMVDGESAEKFTERMRRRWQYLKHLQMDGSKPTPARSLPDMTDEEQAELSDLEERNKQSGGMRWLD
jgi:hypothetical protein